jgi:hypothetical protein
MVKGNLEINQKINIYMTTAKRRKKDIEKKEKRNKNQ